MNKIFTKIAFFALVLSTGAMNAQINASEVPSNKLNESNYFLDASLYQGKDANVGRLLGFPMTDLTTFVFNTAAQTNLLTAKNFFDGVIVYNSATGNTPPASTSYGIQTMVSPGFYYFSNPAKRRVSDGQWKVLGGGGSFVDSTENITSVIIDGKPIYAQTGNFTVANGSTTGTIEKDLANAAAIGSIYRITIFTINGTSSDYYSASVYSFDALGKKIITGSPNMSVVYPAGNYKFMVEYFKKA